jgi:hypothetical protein
MNYLKDNVAAEQHHMILKIGRAFQQVHQKCLPKIFNVVHVDSLMPGAKIQDTHFTLPLLNWLVSLRDFVVQNGMQEFSE